VQGPSGSGGAGLGLAIVDAIVGAHGGVLLAENRQTGGALVRMVLSLPPPNSLEPTRLDRTRGPV
jgi:K+-sensing histidine kinase KdpD